jgi:hypothetical protein
MLTSVFKFGFAQNQFRAKLRKRLFIDETATF